MSSMLSPQDLRSLLGMVREDQWDVFMAFIKGTRLVDERVLFAMHQFDLRTERPTIHRRLQAIYDVSPRTANRIAAAALEMRQICATRMAQTRSILETDNHPFGAKE